MFKQVESFRFLFVVKQIELFFIFEDKGKYLSERKRRERVNVPAIFALFTNLPRVGTF